MLKASRSNVRFTTGSRPLQSWLGGHVAAAGLRHSRAPEAGRSTLLAILVNMGTVWHGNGESGGGPPHSKTLARRSWFPCARSVLECSSPLELCPMNHTCANVYGTRHRGGADGVSPLQGG